MAVESAQMADLNKMVAAKPAASGSPGKVRRQNFKGCKCPTWRCKNGNCPCYAASYPCTSKCKCQGCDSNTGPVTWCKCTVTRCADRRCRCLKGSRRCNSKCECGNCDNRDGSEGVNLTKQCIPQHHQTLSQSSLILSAAGLRN